MRKLASLFLVAALFPTLAYGLVVEGVKYDKAITVEGKSLKLVGAGLREKWFVDVYTLGSYSESGACDTKSLIHKDEAKYLRINMLRDVEAEKMASAIRESFDKVTPKNASPELRSQIKKFLGYFTKKCSKGSVLEFTYVPGKGTALKQDGKQLGAALGGKEFAQLFWSVYFAKNGCCDDLRKQILKSCKK